MAKSEFTLRLVSALVLIPVTLAAVWYGGLAFGGLLWLGGIAVAWEWSRIVESQAFGARFWSLAVLVTAFVVASGLADAGLALAAIAAGIAVVAGVDLLRRRLNWWSLGAVAGVGMPVLALLVLRGSPMLGLVATIWLMVLVWAGDSAAYVTGRLLGGPRLAPAISPGKTWSGAVGGLIASGVVGLVVAWIIGGTSPVSL
ncbi:MAG: phosphatidate cytidylyltransferase, partial [Hyphomicrobiales bacterium]